MGEKIREIHFNNKKELGRESIRKEVGRLRVEHEAINEKGERETAIETIPDYRAREYLKNEVVKSGDSLLQVDKKLRKEHGIKNSYFYLRQRIMRLFKRVYEPQKGIKKMIDKKYKSQ